MYRPERQGARLYSKRFAPRGKIMKIKAINLDEKLSKFDELWSPRVIAEMNDYQFKLAKAHGEFVWHQHDDTDEVFIVLEGTLEIEFENGSVIIQAGELHVVPRGMQHRPVARSPVKLMLVEPRGVINTGEADSDLQADNDVWI